MAYSVRVNRARARTTVTGIGYNKLRKVIDYVHDGATRKATGGPYSGKSGGIGLAASIYKQGPYIAGWSVYGFVGSKLLYAASVEHGARIHPIFPKAAVGVWRFGSRRRPQLRFLWRGKLVFTPHVPMSIHTLFSSHPGQKGKGFLLYGLTRAAVRYRMQFIPYKYGS
jgi:hypothetical protein